jgi:hypothetical protein
LSEAAPRLHLFGASSKTRTDVRQHYIFVDIFPVTSIDGDLPALKAGLTVETV